MLPGSKHSHRCVFHVGQLYLTKVVRLSGATKIDEKVVSVESNSVDQTERPFIGA